MDIKKTVKETIEKITSDPALIAEFKKDPVKAVEKVLGVDLPDDVINPIIDGVKAKMTADKASEVIGSIKKLF